MQQDMFSDNTDYSNNTHDIKKIRNGEYLYIPNFFTKEDSDNYLKSLKNEIAWKQESMNMYGKNVNFPRLTAWYGDNDKPYSFSGITLQPEPWAGVLEQIKVKVEQKTKEEFNSVLLNQYRNGDDSISWHTDAERELGENPTIASVTFGEARVFQMRHIETKEKVSLELEHGSLLIMQGELQHYWQHQIPKTKKDKDIRINLTFRKIY